MTALLVVLEAYGQLLVHDYFMSRHTFGQLHERIKHLPVRSEANPQSISVEAVNGALELACCFYPKRALCLQRSAVLTAMLRRRGIGAHLVIGAQRCPFKAHAWVEVDDRVVNDRLVSQEYYLILEVC
jgi:hypothetical protein